MKLSTSNMALIAGAAVLVVAVLWMPRVPSSSEPAAPMVESSPIELAIAKVSGENPMEGIMELRAMADEEPPNLDAVLWLGRFAVQSGQLEKARERFTPHAADSEGSSALLETSAAASVPPQHRRELSRPAGALRGTWRARCAAAPRACFRSGVSRALDCF